MADGDITLKVNLNTEDIISKSMQLKSTVKGIFDSVDTSKMDSGTQKMLANMDKLVNKAEDYVAKIRNMENTKVDNPWIEETGKQMEAVEQKLQDLYNNMHQVTDDMGNIKLVHTEEEQAEIAKLEQQLNELGSRYAYLSQNASQVTLADLHPEKVREYESALNQTNNEITIAVTKYNELQQATANTGESLGEAGSKAVAFGTQSQSSASTANSAYKKVASTLRGTVSSAFNKVKTSMSRAFSLSTLTSFLKKIALITIGVTTLTAVFNKLKSAVQEGLDNLVQYESETNATNEAMTNLNSSLNYLKNAWGSAFAPVVNYVMPVLTALIDKIADVANYIARLFGTLTGASQVIQAVKTDAEDYASTLDGVSSSASSASSSQSKLNDKLASFDDLNVLGKDSDTSGSGGGGVSSGGTDVSDMFEYVDVDTGEFQWLLDFFDDLKKKVEDSGLLSAIENLWEALQNFKDSAFVQTMLEIISVLGNDVLMSSLSVLTNLLNLLADILNGDLESGLMDLKSLIADLTFDPLIALADVFDRIFGTDIAGWLREFKQEIEDIDISQLKGFEDLSDALDELSTAWEDLTTAVGDFWSLLDESGLLSWLANELARFVGLEIDVLLQGIATALDLLASAISWVADVLEGDWVGVVEDLVDILTTLTLDPLATLASIIDSIFGTDLAGWIDGVQESIDSIQFADFLAKLEEVWGKVQEVWSNVTSAFWLGVGIIAAVMELIKSAIWTVVQWLYDQLPQPIKDMVDNIVNKITELKTKNNELWEKIKTNINDKVQFLKTILATVWGDIKNEAITAFTDLKDSVLSIWSDMVDAIKPYVNTIIGFINGLIGGLEGMVNGLADALGDISLDIPDWVPDWGGKSVSFNLGHISLGRIPTLAEGAVIPPNKEFMAILGDQKSGTNIEAPLDTIKQAVAEELSEQLNVLQEGFASVVQAINNKDLAIGDKAIGQANARYTAQQNKIRGVSW